MPLTLVREEERTLSQSKDGTGPFTIYSLLTFGPFTAPVLLLRELAREEGGPRLHDHEREIVLKHHPDFKDFGAGSPKTPELIHATKDGQFERAIFRPFLNFDEQNKPFYDIGKHPQRTILTPDVFVERFGEEHLKTLLPYTERVGQAFRQFAISNNLREMLDRHKSEQEATPSLENKPKPKH